MVTSSEERNVSNSTAMEIVMSDAYSKLWTAYIKRGERLNEVLDLHIPMEKQVGDHVVCKGCLRNWPCPTYNILVSG